MDYIAPFISLLNEMSPYLLFGFLIAGLLKVYVPKEMYIGHISKPTFRSVLWAAVAGVPLPLCSCGVIPTGLSLRKEGASKGAAVSFLISTPQTGVDSIAATYSLLGLPFALLRPLAAVLMMKGLTPGAALVFLMAGPATSIASITVIGKALGRRTLLIYLCSIVAGAVAFGLLVDYLLPASWFDVGLMNYDLLHAHHHDAFSWLKTLSSALLIGLLINTFIQKYRNSKRIKNTNKMAKAYKVGGMTCNHCRTTVENG
jgi:uncharacterized membrane protein YraQ (UPF0718 family)